MSITDRPESPTISSQLEKGELEVDHDHHADDDLPEKMQGHYIRNLRHQIFTLYRKLFVVIFVANLVAFAALFSLDHHSTEHIGLAVVSNIFCAILIRQEYVINLLFTVFCAVPSSYVSY